MKLAAVTGVASFMVVGVATHLGLLWLSPSWATHHQISEAMKRGAKINTLIYGAPPRAGSTSVPLANPDMLGTRAFLDLSGGPRVLEGLRPQSCTYWSASVFAENTDTLLVRSDRDLPDHRISIGLRMRDQAIGEPLSAEAVLPSRSGVVLLRCFMRDRTDAAEVATLARQIRGLTLRPARGFR